MSKQKVRFSFIESAIIERNEVQRRNLCNAFSITEPTATRLFRAYKEKYPDNLTFDISARCYRASDSFEAQALDPNISAKEFLNAAQIMAEKNIFN